MRIFTGSLTGRPAAVVLALTLALLGLAPGALAQSGQGAIEGTVRDGSGAILPGVTVIATSAESGRSRSVVSDSRGEYLVPRLDPGQYEVRATLPGFRTDPSTITVGSGSASLDIVLGIAPIAETVTVTRTDQALSAVPNAIAVVQRDTIEVGQRRASLDEALRGIPGLFVQNRRNYGLSGGIGLSIRAPQPRFGLRGLAIIQDGIPITTADGTTEPSNVDLGSVGRIDVIRGPNSVLYGNSAGGVINLETTFDTSRALTIRPDIQFGSHGYNRQQVRVDGGNAGTQFMGSFSRFQTDGFRANSSAEITQANFVVRRELTADTEIRGIFNLFDSPFAESPSFLNYADASTDPQRSSDGECIAGACLARGGPTGVAVARRWGEGAGQGQGGVTLEHRFSDTQRFRATGWGMWRDLNAVGAFRNIELGRNGFGFRSEYLGAAEAGAVTIDWAAGVDVATQNDDRMEFGQAGDGSTTDLMVSQTEDVVSSGPFAQIGISPTDRVRFTGGVRWNYYKFTAGDRFLSNGDQSGGRNMDAVSPSVGVTVTAARNVNLFASVATAFETPTTVELSNTATGEGGFNQALNPENLTSFEFGIRGLAEPARLRYEVAFYTSSVTDAFVPVQRPDDEVFQVNAGETSRKGLEMLLEWVPDSSFSARFAYTYQDFVFDRFTLNGTDYAGFLEPGAPPHRVFAGVTHRAPFGLTSIAQLRWVDEYTLNNANTAFNWAYTVVDLRFAFDGKGGDSDLRPFVGIDNLFGERYNSSAITNAFGGRYYEPSPGREVYVGMTVGFGIR